MIARTRRLLATLAATGALLAAAGPADATATTDDVTTATVPALTHYPLTGVAVAPGASVPNRNAMVVKIDNAGPARPQSGLNFADIVFEEIVEGDITRFAAVFQSQGANPVGPIRSGRTQDVDLLSGLTAPIFIWSGGNGGVQRAVNESDFISIPDGSGGVFYRSRDRSAPHNLYAETDVVWDVLKWAVNPPPPLFEYVDTGESVTGQPATFAELMMGGIPVRWEYDVTTDRYARSQMGRTHQTVEGPVVADNVVVLITDYRRSEADPRSPEAVTVGNGITFVLSDGVLQFGTWAREGNRDPINLFTADGDPIRLGPGRTWVELARTEDHQIQTG